MKEGGRGCCGNWRALIFEQVFKQELTGRNGGIISPSFFKNQEAFEFLL